MKHLYQRAGCSKIHQLLFEDAIAYFILGETDPRRLAGMSNLDAEDTIALDLEEAGIAPHHASLYLKFRDMGNVRSFLFVYF